MVSGLWRRPWALRQSQASAQEGRTSYTGARRISFPTAWSMNTCTEDTRTPWMPNSPPWGGWQEENRRDEQWSPAAISPDLCIKEHPHHIHTHVGASSLGGSSGLHHYKKS